jgi:hypothetical protein
MSRTNTIVLCLASIAVGIHCSQEGPGAGNPNSGPSTSTTSSTSGSAGGPSTGSGSTTDSTSSTSGSTTGGGGDPTTSGAGGDPTTSGGGAGGGTTSGGGGGAGGGGPGGGGRGGAAGSAGGAGGGVSVESIVPTLDGFLWTGKCAAGAASGKDCPIYSDSASSCVTNNDFYTRGAFQIKTHRVGGTTGTKYMINFEARGVTGGKEYTGGTRQSTATTFNQTGNDGWRVGGLPTDSKWNTYEIHVTPPVPGQPLNMQKLTCTGCPQGMDNVYYTNSIPNTDGVHETFPIKLTASFPVLGGGTITLVIHDSNCLGQQNCGPDPDSAAMCVQPAPGGPRTIDISGLSPAPMNFVQPYSQANTPNPWYPQWLLFDVKSVAQM